MVRKLILACAGAGKTSYIVRRATEMAERGKVVLILTYTEKNQGELLRQICQSTKTKCKPANIVIKGWFTFLLEEMVRPYQRCIFDKRVPGIFFNSSDPHLVNGRVKKGRAEKVGDKFNDLYFLTAGEGNAHTTYISKLAVRVHEESQGKTARRLSSIYDAVFIDEVQDLTGWDYDVVKAVSAAGASVIECVGDFRQTIYRTSVNRKSPQTSEQKLKAFTEMGFLTEHQNESRRSIQAICSFADLVDAASGSYPATKSLVEEVPLSFRDHQGIVAVSRRYVREYMERYAPVALRHNKNEEQELLDGRAAYNFGEAKGLTFDRVLVVPTKKYCAFLEGNAKPFEKDKTEGSKNKLYVAITRARYSVAFLVESQSLRPGIAVWTPGEKPGEMFRPSIEETLALAISSEASGAPLEAL